jgi:hypothetical protein
MPELMTWWDTLYTPFPCQLGMMNTASMGAVPITVNTDYLVDDNGVKQQVVRQQLLQLAASRHQCRRHDVRATNDGLPVLPLLTHDVIARFADLQAGNCERQYIWCQRANMVCQRPADWTSADSSTVPSASAAAASQQ